MKIIVIVTSVYQDHQVLYKKNWVNCHNFLGELVYFNASFSIIDFILQNTIE